MSSTRTVLIGLIAFSIGMAALVFNRYDEANGGRLGFAVWKATSGQWRGDHHADVNGVQIYYEVHGEGPVILLSHGYSSTSGMWKGQIEALSAKVVAAAAKAVGATLRG